MPLTTDETDSRSCCTGAANQCFNPAFAARPPQAFRSGITDTRVYGGGEEPALAALRRSRMAHRGDEGLKRQQKTDLSPSGWSARGLIAASSLSNCSCRDGVSKLRSTKPWSEIRDGPVLTSSWLAPQSAPAGHSSAATVRRGLRIPANAIRPPLATSTAASRVSCFSRDVAIGRMSIKDRIAPRCIPVDLHHRDKSPIGLRGSSQARAARHLAWDFFDCTR
jgi:hypothetical protein